jgi:predicted outer membrane repeat protein
MNTGGYGGGAAVNWSSPRFVECEFEENSAGMTAAGLNAVNSGVQIEHCVFEENNSNAVYLFYPLGLSAPRIFNCLFFGNGVNTNHGGAIVVNAVNAAIESCTITGNTALNGGAVYSSGGCAPTVTNCILWGNDATSGMPEIHDTGGAATVVTNTDIDQDGYDGLGLGNLRSYPLFITGPRGDFYLSCLSAGQASDSPCLDAGNADASVLGLGGLTTRTNSALDTGLADLGYHYRPDD